MADQNTNNTEVEFEAGQMVIQEKTMPSALYIIKEGQLAVYKLNKDGERIPIGLISSGEYVGEAALLLNRPHSSNVVALTKVKALRLSKDAIEAQLKATPGWFLSLTKGLITRLHQVNEILRKNGLVDEKIKSAMLAIESKSQGEDKDKKAG